MGFGKFLGCVLGGAVAIVAAPIVLPAAAIAGTAAAVAGTAAAAGAAVAGTAAAVAGTAAAVGTTVVGAAAAVGTAAAGTAAVVGTTVAGTAAAVGTVGTAVIGTTVIGASAVVGAAANSVNADYEAELNSINEKMEVLSSETNEAFSNAKSRVKNKLESVAKLKSVINNGSLSKFVDVFGRLKRVEFSETTDLSLAKLENIRNYVLDYNSNSIYGGNRSESAVLATGAIGGVLFGGIFFAGSLIKGVKLQGQIDEAKYEYSKLKAEAEKVKLEIARLEDISLCAEECHKVTFALNKLFVKGIQEMENIIAESGIDYSKYTDDQKGIIRTVVNLACAVKDIVSTPLLNSEGYLNPQVKVAINDTAKLTK